MSEATPVNSLRVSQSPDCPHHSPTPGRDATCRTCTSCRRKKIKCNGKHPQCGCCQSRGVNCVYPQDARRTVVRAKKADVRALQRKIEALQESLGELTGNTAAVGSSDVGFPSLLRRTSQPIIDTPVPIQGALTQPETPQGHAQYHVPPSEEAHTTIEGRSNRTRISRLSSSNTRGNGRPDTVHSPETMLAEEGPQVYGATSLLHDQSSRTPLANRKNGDVEMRFLPPETVQDQLISNAAICRQEELSLASTPNIGANIDFDGVPMDLAMHLLELHWNRQHLSYLLTYRPAIMDSVVKNGPYVNKLLLNALYLQSSMYSDRISFLFENRESNSKGLVFYERFKSLLPNYIDKPTIPTVVALLTCGACLVPYGYQSAGWALSGMGYQMITDLGCHLDSPAASKPAAIEQEMKKRIYWGAFVSDKFQSLFLGRPIAMHESTGNVTSDYLDSFEEMEEWTPYVDTLTQPANNSVQIYRGRPSRAISTFQSLLQLSKIATQIIEAFYSVGSLKSSELVLLHIKSDVTGKLGCWRDNLPPWLLFDPSVDATPPPHQITPHALYWTLVILTEQAFLNRGRFNFTLDPDSAEASRQECIQAALSIWRLVEAYKRVFTLRRAQYLISYATYCAALVMLQQTTHESNEYVECIQFLWSALSEYQKGTCYGLKRPLRLLKSLMRRLGRVAVGIEAEESVLNWPAPATASHTTRNPEVHQHLESEHWDVSLLGNIPDDTFLIDDSIFGIFGA